jgi:hypothetical protein
MPRTKQCKSKSAIWELEANRRDQCAKLGLSTAGSVRELGERLREHRRSLKANINNTDLEIGPEGITVVKNIPLYKAARVGNFYALTGEEKEVCSSRKRNLLPLRTTPTHLRKIRRWISDFRVIKLQE